MTETFRVGLTRDFLKADGSLALLRRLGRRREESRIHVLIVTGSGRW
ncbi:MAG TPA: hypothetical protein VKV73_32010 [Chloroflexota bacterium]|nr:hypothetical protein [Chloroflexota bacterium]